MDEVQQAVIKSAKTMYKEEYVNKGLMEEHPFKGVGMQYIFFSVNEPKLFQLLFMTEQSQMPDLTGVLPSVEESYNEILLSIQADYGILRDKQFFSRKAISSSLDIYTRHCNTLCYQNVPLYRY